MDSDIDFPCSESFYRYFEYTGQIPKAPDSRRLAPQGSTYAETQREIERLQQKTKNLQQEIACLIRYIRTLEPPHHYKPVKPKPKPTGGIEVVL